MNHVLGYIQCFIVISGRLDLPERISVGFYSLNSKWQPRNIVFGISSLIMHIES